MISYTSRCNANGTRVHQATVRVPGFKSKSRTCADLQKVRQWAENVEASLKSNTPIPFSATSVNAAAKALTFTELVDERIAHTMTQFVASDDASKRHKKTANTIIKNIRDSRICDIGKSWMKEYIDRMLKTNSYRHTPYAPATIAVHIQIMRTAIKWRAETNNLPLPRLDHLSTKHLPPGWDVERDRLLEEDEEKLLRAHFDTIEGPMGVHWRCLFGLSLETGARLQELVLANWREVNFKLRIWSIPRHHIKVGPARVIPLSIEATRLMHELKAVEREGNPRLFHLIGTPDSASTRFRQHKLEAGVQGYRFHDNRHESITRMVLNKPLKDSQVMKISGHRSTRSFLRYANLRMAELVPLMG